MIDTMQTLTVAVKRLSVVLAMLIGLTILPAEARMYQWKDPDTGTTQLSGTPPPWYRSKEGGPRVFVFERGQLIDDTGREVSEQRRRFLREQAINQAIAAEEEKRARTMPAEPEPEPLDPGILPDLLLPLPETEPVPIDELAKGAEPEAGEAADAAAEELSAEEIRAMRALITEWENRRQREAREILESGGAAENIR